MNVSAADRFAELVARHGADPARWPAQEHAWMNAYRRDAAAAADDVMQQAAALDAWLDAAPLPPVPRTSLRANILAAAANAPQPSLPASRPGMRATLAALWRDLGGARLAGPALAMALAAGIGLGWMLQPPATDTSEIDSEDLLALAQLDDHYSELSP